MSLNVAIAGTGYIAHYHARAVKAAGGHVSAVLSRTEASGSAFASEHGGTVFTDIDELLTSGPDALVLAVPNQMHAAMALAAFDAGVDVLVEKPMALDAPQARRMRERAQESGRVLMIGHMWRYDPQAIWLRDAVTSGQLGAVIKTKSYGVHVDWGPSGWFTDPELAGGGSLIDMGVHAIDTTRFLLGDPAPLSVYARLGTRYRQDPVDDHGIILIDWDNGTNSLIECGWWNPHADGEEASTQIFGTGGYARLFPTAMTMGAGDEKTQIQPEFPARSEHCDQSIYDAQMQAFFSDCAARTTPLAGPAVGETIMQICDAAYRSSANNAVVFLG
ncbi:MAG: putative dehydrogenase [Bradymonadia bacterium]|jgi:predicted dehydrogenase